MPYLNRFAATLLVSSSLTATALIPAEAQDTAPFALEEIVVTAERRAQSLQDVPISIAAFTGEFLDDLQINEINDLAVQTPSLAFSRAGGEAQVYIRGVGTNAFGVTVDPSVALHSDGVYLARANMGLTQFLDVERVEILRGPQGTLYGRNATAGAINIISRKPSEEWEGYARGAVGNFSSRQVEAAAGGAIADGVRVRFAGKASLNDGYTEDLDPRGQNEIDDENLLAMRAIAQFGPMDGDFGYEVIAEWSEFTSGNRTIRPLDDLGTAQFLGAQPLGPFGTTRNDLDTFFDWEFWGITGTGTWNVTDSIELKSITGFRSYDSDFLFNTDGTEIDVTRSNFEYSTDQISQEFQLIGSHDQFDWIAGLYYLHEEKEGGLGLIRASRDQSFIIPNDGTTDALAAFGQVTWTPVDAVSLIVGLRYSYERKEDFTTVGGIFAPGDFLSGLDSASPVTIFSTRDTSENWNDLSPRFVLQYRPTDDVQLYASVTKGFKSGGFDAFAAGDAFNEEIVWSYEGGARSEWLNGRLQLNGTFFYYDYSDLQVSTTRDSLTFIDNAASATNWGFEVEMQALLTPQWSVGVTGSFLDATYDEFISPFGTCPAGATPEQLAQCNGAAPGEPIPFDNTGNRLTNAPKGKFNIRSTYEVPTDYGTWALFGQVSYQSRVFFSQINEDIVSQDGFATVDGRLSFTSADDRWELAFYGKNIFDEEYLQNVVRFTSTSQDAPFDPLGRGNALGYPGEGRTFGGQATFRF